MKVIDKRTKNASEHYAYGDIVKCWNYDPDEYNLLRISAFYDVRYGQDRCIAVIIHNSSGNETKVWARFFDSPEEAAKDLKKSYNHVEKVNAYIVITY